MDLLSPKFQTAALGHKQPFNSLSLDRLLSAKSGHWTAVRAGSKCSALVGVELRKVHFNQHASDNCNSEQTINQERRLHGKAKIPLLDEKKSTKGKCHCS